MLYADKPLLRSRAYPQLIRPTGLKTVTYTDGTPDVFRHYSADISPVQYTWSEGHPVSFIGQADGGSVLDVGGPFLTGRLHIPPSIFSPCRSEGSFPGGKKRYAGVIAGAYFTELQAYKQNFVPTWTFEQSKGLKVFEDLSSTNSLVARGTTAISRCKPDKQNAGLFVTLRETYNDGLPRVPGVSRARVQAAMRDYRAKRSSGIYKGSAEEYLNIVFGVLPLLADAKALHSSIKGFEENLDNFLRNAGKPVRRSYRFPRSKNEVTSTSVNLTSIWPSDVGTDTTLFSGVVLKPHVHTKSVQRDQWFSGSFTYYIDEQDTLISRMRELNAEGNYLFGAGLTLENLWNSSPWTWMVDWFVNAGDVLSNLSSVLANDLVLNYGYMMEQTIARHNCDAGTVSAKPSSPVPRSAFYQVIAKQRIRATPFGFGLSEAGLSAKQKLILAALGITRV